MRGFTPVEPAPVVGGDSRFGEPMFLPAESSISKLLATSLVDWLILGRELNSRRLAADQVRFELAHHDDVAPKRRRAQATTDFRPQINQHQK
jgi:hypothetical protein